MIFTPENIIKTLLKLKTQTRRIWKEGYTLQKDYARNDGFVAQALLSASGRPIFIQGNDYPLQAGRGKYGLWYMTDHPCNGLDIWDDITPADYAIARGQGYKPARILIKRLWEDRDVRQISEEDVKAEGYPDAVDFWLEWAGMHDMDFFRKGIDAEPENGTKEAWSPVLMKRPAEKYHAVGIEYEVVEG